HHEWQVGEGSDDVFEPGPVRLVVAEGPGELEEDCAQPAAVAQQVESRPGLLHVVSRPGRLALVGESLPELRGEAEAPVDVHALDPALGGSVRRGTIEGGIDL